MRLKASAGLKQRQRWMPQPHSFTSHVKRGLERLLLSAPPPLAIENIPTRTARVQCALPAGKPSSVGTWVREKEAPGPQNNRPKKQKLTTLESRASRLVSRAAGAQTTLCAQCARMAKASTCRKRDMVMTGRWVVKYHVRKPSHFGPRHARESRALRYFSWTKNSYGNLIFEFHAFFWAKK